ncbi:hypothetical protein NPIL_463751 [Nephila pilipes]|uniref:Uncharacterized protein n=1 Tax=Nephila pilipes TaxID=299642 RepID=A0A8X6TQ70_NEPPI|nr:hypothetical protein NPIL_463751 [Nephila pilipes]
MSQNFRLFVVILHLTPNKRMTACFHRGVCRWRKWSWSVYWAPRNSAVVDSAGPPSDTANIQKEIKQQKIETYQISEKKKTFMLLEFRRRAPWFFGIQHMTSCSWVPRDIPL